VKIPSPVKVIRAKCKECTGGGLKAIRLCEIIDCPLHPYRMGRNPNRAGIGNLKGSFSKKLQS